VIALTHRGNLQTSPLARRALRWCHRLPARSAAESPLSFREWHQV